MEVKRFDVFLIALDPTRGSEVSKTRPGVIVSPDEMNRHLNTVIVAPLTSTIKEYPCRVGITFEGKKGEVALDQIRCIDKIRLKKRLGRIDERVREKICDVLIRIFQQ
jgi:mRNA interferase MazF